MLVIRESARTNKGKIKKVEGRQTVNVAASVKEFCEEQGETCQFYDKYSRHGMCGRFCVGILTSDSPVKTIVRLCDFLRDYECGTAISSAESVLGDIYTDSLGRKTIIYFPSISNNTDESELD